MTQDSLLPCPHCGGTAYVAPDYGSSFSVKCNNPICGAAVRLWGTRDGAIAAWNRRAPDAALEALEAWTDYWADFWGGGSVEDCTDPREMKLKELTLAALSLYRQRKQE